jgi:hypothetical protein
MVATVRRTLRPPTVRTTRTVPEAITAVFVMTIVFTFICRLAVVVKRQTTAIDEGKDDGHDEDTFEGGLPGVVR